MAVSAKESDMVMSENTAIYMQRLKVPSCPTEIYLEMDDRDMFLSVNGWLSPELAQALIAALRCKFGDEALRLVS